MTEWAASQGWLIARKTEICTAHQCSTHLPVAPSNFQSKKYLFFASNSIVLVGDRRFNSTNGSFFVFNRITFASPFDNCVSRVNLYVLLSENLPMCLIQPVQESKVTLSASRQGRNTNRIAVMHFDTAMLRKYCHIFNVLPLQS